MTYRLSSYRLRMAVFALAAALAGLAVPHDAVAASCDSVAQRFAQSRGATVLAVRDLGAECEVRILIRRGNRPPRRRTVVLPK